VVSSPMMVGTDIRLMTPIMKELLLNDEMIAIK
jgi:alpha-galactosidase